MLSCHSNRTPGKATSALTCWATMFSHLKRMKTEGKTINLKDELNLFPVCSIVVPTTTSKSTTCVSLCLVGWWVESLMWSRLIQTFNPPASGFQLVWSQVCTTKPQLSCLCLLRQNQVFLVLASTVMYANVVWPCPLLLPSVFSSILSNIRTYLPILTEILSFSAQS